VSELRRLAAPAAALTAILGLVVLFRPVPFGFAFRAWLVALGALAAAALVRGSLAPYRKVRVNPVRLRRPSRAIAERPAGLEEVERAVDFAKGLGKTPIVVRDVPHRDAVEKAAPASGRASKPWPIFS